MKVRLILSANYTVIATETEYKQFKLSSMNSSMDVS